MSRHQHRTVTLPRFFTRRRVVSPIPGWDHVDFSGMPSYDVDALRADVVARVEEHLADGSVDEAHADVVDRLVHALTDVWRAQLHVAYIARFDELEERRVQGVEHLARLDTRISVQTARRDEAERTRREALARLAGRRAEESGDGVPAPVPPLPPAAPQRRPLAPPHLSGSLGAPATT